VAKLVLLKKKEGDSDDPGIYRPICLLNESCKLFERIIGKRINDYTRISGVLSDDQFGFREGRSTIDAIKRVKQIVDNEKMANKTVILVSFDISNAFNSLPWKTIIDGMKEMRFPTYLIAIVFSYLSNRRLTYVNENGDKKLHKVSCGVPQGSALGPIRWNIGYNRILKINLLYGARMVCYADYTLLIASGNDWNSAVLSANANAYKIIDEIERLGLKIATQKTVAMGFRGPNYRNDRRNMFVNRHLYIKNQRIVISKELKYLGVNLDDKGSFVSHFNRIKDKIEFYINKLYRIMPNLRGPNMKVRKLYVNVIYSILLYGAPIWSKSN